MLLLSCVIDRYNPALVELSVSYDGAYQVCVGWGLGLCFVRELVCLPCVLCL